MALSAFDEVRNLISKVRNNRYTTKPIVTAVPQRQNQKSKQVPYNLTPMQKFASSPVGNFISNPLTYKNAQGQTFSDYRASKPTFQQTLQTPIPLVSKIPGVKNLQQAVGNTGAAIEGYATGTAKNAYRIATGLRDRKPLQIAGGTAGMVYSGGKALAAASPYFQVPNIISSLPQIGRSDIPRRLSAGIAQGVSMTPEVAQNVPDRNVNINTPLGDISFDPVKGVGGMYGFIKNPTNSKLFQLTEKFLPAGSVLAKGNFQKWLSITAARGGIEDIFIGMSEMPDNVSTKEKLEYMARNFGTGMASEVFMRGGGEVAQKSLSKVMDTQLAIKAFDGLKEIYRNLNSPIRDTNKFNEKTGKYLTEPMWKYELRRIFKKTKDQTGAIGDTQLANIKSKISLNKQLSPDEMKIARKSLSIEEINRAAAKTPEGVTRDFQAGKNIEARAKDTQGSLIQEAKKYKSAEEFVSNIPKRLDSVDPSGLFLKQIEDKAIADPKIVSLGKEAETYASKAFMGNSSARSKQQAIYQQISEIRSKNIQSQLTDIWNKANDVDDSLYDIKPIETKVQQAGLNLGDVKEVNDFLKIKGVIVEGSGTKTATIKIPKEIIDTYQINKNGMTLKGNYYEIQRPGALFNIHGDKTTLAQSIQVKEAEIARQKIGEGMTPEQARAEFQKSWSKAYGDRPATVNMPSQLQQRKIAGKPTIDQSLNSNTPQPPASNVNAKYFQQKGITPQEAQIALKQGQTNIKGAKEAVRQPQLQQPQIPQSIEPPVKIQSLSSSLPASIPKDEKYAFNINKPKLGLTGEAAQKLDKVVNEMRPILEKNKGKPLTHAEIITEGRKANLLTEVMSREETKRFVASLQATRNLIRKQTNVKGVSPEYLRQMEILSSTAADAGRKLNAFGITAEDAGIKEQVVKDLIKIGTDAKDIVDASKNVDWNNSKQVTDFYRKFKPATYLEALEEFRYTNMLSSPNTHIVNTFSNFLQTGIVAPIEKTLTGSLDFVRAKLTGTEQKYFASQGIDYATGYWKALPDAWGKFRGILGGSDTLRKPDVDFIPTGTGRVQRAYTTPLRALEATDQFFRTLTIGGETKALKRAGITGEEALKIANQSADYRTFRQKFDPDGKLGQGDMLKTWDKWNSAMSQIRRLPGGKWLFPFLQTPTNILKQGVEYSPLGITTLKGSKNPMEQLSKTIIGTGVFMGATAIANAGLTTFAPPTAEKERDAFYAAGLQPYAVKIGDKWVSYSKLGPLSYPFAAAASLKWAEDNGTDKSDLENFGRGIAGITRFFSDQSYVKNIGDIIEVTSESDPNKLIKSAEATAANLVGQVIPYRSFMGWITRMTDPVYRKGRGFNDRIKTQIPGLSTQVEAYKTPTGEDSKRQFPILNSFIPTKLTQENAGAVKDYKDYKNILNLKREDTKIKEEQKTQIEAMYDTLKSDVTRQEKIQALSALKDNPEMTAEFKAYLKEQVKAESVGPLTTTETNLKSAPITVRAKYISNEIQQAKTREDKIRILKSYWDKKILTKDVIEAMKNP